MTCSEKGKTLKNNFNYIIRYLLYTTAAAAFESKHLVYKIILVLMQTFTRCRVTVKGTVSWLLVQLDGSYLWGLQPQWGALDSRLLRVLLQQRRHSALYLWDPLSLEKVTQKENWSGLLSSSEQLFEKNDQNSICRVIMQSITNATL